MLNYPSSLPLNTLHSSLEASGGGDEFFLSTLPATLSGELARLRKEVASFSTALTLSERKALDAETLSAKYKNERDVIILNSRVEAEAASKEEAKLREAAALKIAEDARSRTIALEAALKEAQNEIHVARSMGEQWSRDSMQLSREVRELRAALEAARSAGSASTASVDPAVGTTPRLGFPADNSITSSPKHPSSAPQLPLRPPLSIPSLLPPHATHLTTATSAG